MDTATRDAIRVELKAARDIAEVAEQANRDLETDERTKITGHLSAAKALQARAEDQDALRKQLTDLSDGIGMVAPDATPKPQAAGYGSKRGASLGHSYINSAEYKSLVGSVPEGRFGEKARVQSQPFGVKSLITGVDDASAGSLVYPDRLGLLDPFYARPLTLRQLVTNGTTETDTIEFVRMLSVTNAAAPVPEATSSAAIDGTIVTNVLGGVKPEGAMTFEKASTTVKTIAEWIPATKRSLSDASQIKTLIDTFLLYGLEEELEDQIIGGTGVGENFLGIAATSGIQTQAVVAGKDNLHMTRLARTKVRIGGRSVPTAYAMNPIDWQNIELLRDLNGVFYGHGPFELTTPRLWGLPVVESEAIPAGTAYVADWSKAILWDREQASIQVTDSHEDFFIRNLVAILAEMRAAFAVLRPQAFVKITLA